MSAAGEPRQRLGSCGGRPSMRVRGACQRHRSGPRGGALPLVEAVKAGDLAAVRALLKQPNAAKIATADGTTPLHVATDLDDLGRGAAAGARRCRREGRQPLRRDAAVLRGRSTATPR